MIARLRGRDRQHQRGRGGDRRRRRRLPGPCCSPRTLQSCQRRRRGGRAAHRDAGARGQHHAVRLPRSGRARLVPAAAGHPGRRCPYGAGGAGHAVARSAGGRGGGAGPRRAHPGLGRRPAAGGADRGRAQGPGRRAAGDYTARTGGAVVRFPPSPAPRKTRSRHWSIWATAAPKPLPRWPAAAPGWARRPRSVPWCARGCASCRQRRSPARELFCFVVMAGPLKPATYQTPNDSRGRWPGRAHCCPVPARRYRRMALMLLDFPRFQEGRDSVWSQGHAVREYGVERSAESDPAQPVCRSRRGTWQRSAGAAAAVVEPARGAAGGAAQRLPVVAGGGSAVRQPARQPLSPWNRPDLPVDAGHGQRQAAGRAVRGAVRLPARAAGRPAARRRRPRGGATDRIRPAFG